MSARISNARRVAARTRVPRWLSSIGLYVLALLVSGCGAGTGVVTSSGGCGQAVSGGVQRAPANAAACTGSRCYGITRWTASGGGSTNLSTFITTAALACNSVCAGGSGFIDDEEWLSDNSGNWIEAGYGTFSGGTFAFWADERQPVAGRTKHASYNEHFLGTPRTGANAQYAITLSSTNTFGVSYQDSSTACGNQRSTDNPLNTSSTNGDVGIEEYNNTTGSPPQCGASTGLTAQNADFSSINFDGTNAPSGGAPYTAPAPLDSNWNTAGTDFTTSCT